MPACVVNCNTCVCDKLQLHAEMTNKNDVTQNTYHTNTNNVTQMCEKTLSPRKKGKMGTMWHITQNTQCYLTKQILPHTLFLQPMCQRVFSTTQKVVVGEVCLFPSIFVVNGELQASHQNTRIWNFVTLRFHKAYHYSPVLYYKHNVGTTKEGCYGTVMNSSKIIWDVIIFSRESYIIPCTQVPESEFNFFYSSQRGSISSRVSAPQLWAPYLLGGGESRVRDVSQISDGILFIIWGYLLFLSVVLFASMLRYSVSFFSRESWRVWLRWVGLASFLLPRELINSGLLYLLVMNVDIGWINICVGCSWWFN